MVPAPFVLSAGLKPVWVLAISDLDLAGTLPVAATAPSRFVISYRPALPWTPWNHTRGFCVAVILHVLILREDKLVLHVLVLFHERLARFFVVLQWSEKLHQVLNRQLACLSGIAHDAHDLLVLALLQSQKQLGVDCVLNDEAADFDVGGLANAVDA